MMLSGQVALFQFPQTERLLDGKLRPALVLAKLPGQYDDWLICTISSQLRHCIGGFDEIISESDADFAQSGLKAASVIRIGRLAVVEANALIGSIGFVTPERLQSIKSRLAAWITANQ